MDDPLHVGDAVHSLPWQTFAAWLAGGEAREGVGAEGLVARREVEVHLVGLDVEQPGAFVRLVTGQVQAGHS